MKKFSLVLLAVLFTLSLVTCGLFDAPPVAESSIEWDDGLGPLQPGEFFVGMDKTQGRALTEALAQAGADYFEVVFAAGAQIERVAFNEGRIVRMRAPVYDQAYNNTGTYKAYVFAGRNESRTLLGIGMIIAVEGDDNTGVGDFVIKQNTTAVTFKLEAILNDVKASPTSTFSVNETGVSTISVPVTGNYNVPVYILPKNTADMAASYDFTLTNNHGFTVNLFDAIYYDAGDGIITTRPTVLEGYENQLAVGVTTANIDTDITGANSATAKLAVEFEISTPDKDGLGLLYIDIPVFLFDGPTGFSPTAVPWRLRGGLNNALIDIGVSHNNGDGSLGGAILIGVGSVFDGAGFEVVHSY